MRPHWMQNVELKTYVSFQVSLLMIGHIGTPFLCMQVAQIEHIFFNWD